MPTSPLAKMAAFAAVLALVLAASFGVARAVAPHAAREAVPAAAMPGMPGTTGMAGMGSGAGGHAGAHDEAGATPQLQGLAVEASGYRLVPEATTLAAGPAVPFRFRVEQPDGSPLLAYDRLHDRDLHLIVVRRDLTGFQHVHPTRDAAGTWSAALALPVGGTWRAFADLDPGGSVGQVTLGIDLQVAGTYAPGALAPAAVPADGFDVGFDRQGGAIAVTVKRDGQPVVPEPYLGARGDLVAIRSGDLAYAHVHPEDGDGPTVRFDASLPPGACSLFFDFSVDGVVRTATTTIEVPR